MADNLAQRIVQDWLLSKGYSTTPTVNGLGIVVHYAKYTGFAKIHLSADIPSLQLCIYRPEEYGRSNFFGWGGGPSGYYADSPIYDVHQMSLGNPECLDNVSRLLEKAVFAYIDISERYL